MSEREREEGREREGGKEGNREVGGDGVREERRAAMRSMSKHLRKNFLF